MMEREPEQLNTPEASEEYSLEDIVREFGGTPGPAAEEVPEEPVAEKIPEEPLAEEIPEAPVSEEVSDEPEEPAAPAVTGDTLQFTAVRKKNPAAPQTTIRIGAPLREADEVAAEAAETDKAEPSPDMMAADTAVLPEPIPIPSPKERQKNVEPTPQSVLKETEAGRKVQQFRTVLLGILAAASILLTFYAAESWDFLGLSAGTPAVLLMILLSAAVLLSYDVLWRGVRDLIHVHPSPFTLSIPLIVLAGLDALRAEPSRPGNYCGAVTLLLFFLMRALCAERRGRFHTLRAVCGFQNPMGIFSAPPVNEGAPSLRRDPANVNSFLADLLQKDRPEMLLSVYCTLLFPLSAALAFLLTRNGGDFFLAWLLLMLGGLPFFSALGYPRVLAALAKRLGSIGGALSGWHSAKVFGGSHTIIIRDEDLFPLSGITTNGMKLYGTHRPNKVIAYALAALDAAGSPLAELFEGLLKAQYGTHSVVSTYRIYDNNGIGAEIGGDIVLVGSLPFMHSMGVHMSSGAKVRLAVYVSVNGELAGIFALKYKANNSSRKGLRDVLANRNFSVVLATRDFLITPELIAAKYRLPTDHMKYPGYPERLRLAELDPNRKAEQGALIAKDTFGAFASTVAAGHTLRIAARTALILCLIAAATGIALCALLVLWKSQDAASPVHILTFQLLWAVALDLATVILLKF